MNVKLNEIDWQIIELLSDNYMPNSEIARQLGVSEGTIRRRIKTLQSAGVMKVRGQLDPEILEDKQLAIVMANIEKARQLNEKAQEISSLENVSSVSIISGQYDLMIEIIVDSNKGVMRFLTENLSTIEGISKTETFIILKSIGKFI